MANSQSEIQKHLLVFHK